MNRWTILLTAIFIGIFVVMGCSNSGSDPVAPTADPVITSGTSNHGTQAQTQLWGYWDIYIDAENMTAEVVNNRQAMFTANVTRPINKNPAALAISFNGLNMYPDYIDVDLDLSVTHPFPGQPVINGYDVRGVFMGNGSMALDYNSDLFYPVPGTDQLLLADEIDGFGGPDGYTRWFNISEFSMGGPPLFSYTQGSLASKGFDGSATICPYKYFADDLDATTDAFSWLTANTDTNGVFSSGSTNTRNMFLRFPTSVGLVFGYAIIADWKGALPDDHPANAMEAMACDVVDNSNVYYVDDMDNGGNLMLEITVFDWAEHTLVGGVMEDYTLWIDSTVLSTPYEFDDSDMTPGASGDKTYTYNVSVPADIITGVDDQEYWIIVESADYDYTNPFGAPNGADSALAGFFRYDLPVSDEPGCPTPMVISVDPISAMTGAITTVSVECIGLEDGPDLAASLVMLSAPDIIGTNVTFIDDTALTADFDLAGAMAGLWDVVVTNGCGGVPGIGPGLFEVLDCPPPTIVGIAPAVGYVGSMVDDATITCTDLIDGPMLMVRLLTDGEPPIEGSDITFIDDTSFTADFDLTDAALGLYDVMVSNGCGGMPGLAEDLFEVMELTEGLYVLDSGNLPDLLPVPDDKQFCVVGDDSLAHAGVYYFGEDYDILYYPLDYSAPGMLYFAMEGAFSIPEADFFGPAAERGAIEVDPSGGVTITMHGTGYIWSTNSQNMCSVWFEPDNPVVSNALTLNTSGFGLVRTRDAEGAMGAQDMLWTLYGTETVMDPSVTIVQNGVQFGYTGGAYAGWNVDWAPLDQVGSVDGEVSDLEAYKFAVDSEPEGLSGTLDYIFYYLEGAPDDAGIEVFANNLASIGVDQTYLTTIDDVFVGTPIDISCLNSFGVIPDALGNWLCVLEDNGDSTWQVALFDQEGTLIQRLPITQPGDALGLDCDLENQEIHVWADDGGTLKYTIIAYSY